MVPPWKPQILHIWFPVHLCVLECWKTSGIMYSENNIISLLYIYLLHVTDWYTKVFLHVLNKCLHKSIYFSRPRTRNSVSWKSSYSWRLNTLTVISVPFHELIEIQAPLLQSFLHIIQGFFFRVWRSEQDVNACWKRRVNSCRRQLR
jgi:hypothetical protein